MPPRSIQEDLELLRDAVEGLTSLPSRWSGHVVLLDSVQMQALKGVPTLAEKQWHCDILVNTALVASPMRWSTLIHEMLHSVSVGLNPENYVRFRGWEEGTVEQVQRLIRPQILTRYGISTPNEAFTEREKHWKYNPYIEALEGMRDILQIPVANFYLDLLRLPLAQRLAFVRSLSAAQDFRRLFAYSVGKLR